MKRNQPRPMTTAKTQHNNFFPRKRPSSKTDVHEQMREREPDVEEFTKEGERNLRPMKTLNNQEPPTPVVKTQTFGPYVKIRDETRREAVQDMIQVKTPKRDHRLWKMKPKE